MPNSNFSVQFVIHLNNLFIQISCMIHAFSIINDLAKDTSRYLSYLRLSIRATIEPSQKWFFDAGIRTHNIEDGKVCNEALLNPSPSESMA